MRSNSNKDVIWLKNDEFLICKGTSCGCARLNADYAYNIPNETTVKK
jgi:hypothetical protein